MSDYLQQNDLKVKQFGPPAEAEPGALAEGEGSAQFPPQSPPQALSLPNQRDRRTGGPLVQPCAPGFTLVEGDCKPFAKEYAPKMECPNYIGDTEMLLRYLFREERRNHITMPIRTCGIDPIVFDYVERLDNGDEENPQKTNYFAIAAEDADPESEGEDHIYELIEVDNNLYLSCMSECLDPDYLHHIITEATTTMRETGSYIFRMVGLRRLAVDDNGGTGRLLETLRLNTYEMSALCSYMSDFGVDPSFETIDGHRCICFRSR